MAIDIVTLGANPAKAREQTMLRRLLNDAKSFYQDPKNVEAYKAWIKKKEAISNGSNHDNP